MAAKWLNMLPKPVRVVPDMEVRAIYSASFRIMGRSLDPDEISKTLKLKPTQAHRRGDKNIGKSGRRYSDFREGLWLLESGIDEKMPAPKHIKKLVSILLPKRQKLHTIAGQRGVRMDISLGIFGRNYNWGFFLEKQLLANIAKLPIDIDFDIYDTGK
ncbi:MAG: DUF4279 domain-containing protein [Planctomycetes bacterium]|nr:DUF4279 domain-containing protein [Planctomycetota bacterium]NUQ33929.1 DUF4279 domain-containing protein [Planctomycetaceae bacterium]